LCEDEFELTVVLVERGTAATRAVRVLDIWSYYVLGTESDADHTRRGFIFHLNPASKVPRQTSRLANSSAVRQPGQQHARRIPSFSSEHTRSICCFLGSGFFTEMTQQIHSLRASGVMSSHFARAAESEMRAVRKSGGTVCTPPWESTFLAINFILHRG
jgi:hypothetical protein